jgi:hypothetical protein
MGSNMTFLDYQQPISGLGASVGDFWQWAYSDILSNRNRSIFAEYIIGVALGVADKPRVEWDSADLYYRGFNIEVKSSADCQSWFQKKPSTIRFGIGKAVFWNTATSLYEGDPKRCADVYVFCHYPEQDRSKANVLDVPAWDFYVVSTTILNEGFKDAKSLSLSAVRRVGVRSKFDELRATVDRMLEGEKSTSESARPV